MNTQNSRILSLVLLFLASSFSISAQDPKLCVGGYWTEDEANRKMKEFSATWNDLET